MRTPRAVRSSGRRLRGPRGPVAVAVLLRLHCVRLVPCLLLPAAFGTVHAQTASDPVLDHLILGVGDLERGIEEFERRTGVRPVFGGAHPGRGTQNALVSLGEGAYLEILAPNREDPAFETAGLEPLVAMERLAPIGWAVRTRDLDALGARLRARGFETSDPMPGSRIREDGSRLAWRTLGIRPPADAPPLPYFFFYIEWGDPELHPARTSPGGCSLAAFTLEHPEAESLGGLLEATGATSLAEGRVEVRTGETPVLAFELACPEGPAAFP